MKFLGVLFLGGIILVLSIYGNSGLGLSVYKAQGEWQTPQVEGVVKSNFIDASVSSGRLAKTLEQVQNDVYGEFDNEILTSIHIPTAMATFYDQATAILIDNRAFDNPDKRYNVKSQNGVYVNLNALLNGNNIYEEKKGFMHYGGLLTDGERIFFNELSLSQLELKENLKMKTNLIKDYSGEVIGVVFTVI